MRKQINKTISLLIVLVFISTGTNLSYVSSYISSDKETLRSMPATEHAAAAIGQALLAVPKIESDMPLVKTSSGGQQLGLLKQEAVAKLREMLKNNDLKPPVRRLIGSILMRIKEETVFQEGSDISQSDNISSRRTEIETLLKEIESEIQVPGTGHLPELAVISDYHGEINLFLKYAADAISQKTDRKIELDHKAFPQKTLKDQLDAQGVDISKIDMEFLLLGDFLDRGAFGIKCFRLAEEMLNLGIARYVTGNHDLWAFLNVMGFHLPIYKGYNFYGHKKSENLVEEHWDDPEIAENRIVWWTDKLAEYNAAQKELQKDLLLNYGGEKRKTNDIREEFKEIYLEMEDSLSEAEKKLWQDLVGYYFGETDVYTGFRAVGMMSSRWWKDKADKIDKIIESDLENAAPTLVLAWSKLRSYAGQADIVVGARLNDALSQGEWWWQVFNDINHQNYTSVEWWGKDWSSHSGWGTSVIDELNLSEDNKVWNQANYVENSNLKDLALFYRKNFILYQKDAYGNVYTHGWLPIFDIKTGQISFTYKGITYEDRDIWGGLEAIQNDVRDLNKPLSELHEALALVNSWYADNTTKIKPKEIKAYIYDVGLEKIYSRLGIRCWFTCHNPLNKLAPKGINFKTQQGLFLHFSVDKGMSYKKFKDLGAYTSISSEGIFLRGFSSSSFQKIIDNPPTVTLDKDEEFGYIARKIFPNEPLDRENFLVAMREQLREELSRIKGVSPEEAIEKIETIVERFKKRFETKEQPSGVQKTVAQLNTLKQILTPLAALRAAKSSSAGLTAEELDTAAFKLAFMRGETQKLNALNYIYKIASEQGIFPASIHDLYMAMGRDEIGGFTVPAIDIRGLSYDTARAVFKAAIERKVGVFIFEVARSELEAGQDSLAYAGQIILAAMREGYKGPLYFQIGHGQINAKKDYAAEITTLKDIFKKAIVDAKFGNIDIDTSTLALTEGTVAKQQAPNAHVTAKLLRYIREIEPAGVTISVGGEVGEAGGRNTTFEDVKAYMERLNSLLSIDNVNVGLSKLSIETGRFLSRVPLPDKASAEVKIDFGTIEQISMMVKRRYGISGAVQHDGASTLPDEGFSHFVEREAPEVHLLTGFQHVIHDPKLFPDELRNKMNEIYERLLESTQFVSENRELEMFKKFFWDLPEDTRAPIREHLEKKIGFLFEQLDVCDTMNLQEYAIPVPIEKSSSAGDISKVEVAIQITPETEPANLIFAFHHAKEAPMVVIDVSAFDGKIEKANQQLRAFLKTGFDVSITFGDSPVQYKGKDYLAAGIRKFPDTMEDINDAMELDVRTQSLDYVTKLHLLHSLATMVMHMSKKDFITRYKGIPLTIKIKKYPTMNLWQALEQRFIKLDKAKEEVIREISTGFEILYEINYLFDGVGKSSLGQILLTYKPVSQAIGDAAIPIELTEHRRGHIQELIADKLGAKGANVDIIYGGEGSINNIRELTQAGYTGASIDAASALESAEEIKEAMESSPLSTLLIHSESMRTTPADSLEMYKLLEIDLDMTKVIHVVNIADYIPWQKAIRGKDVEALFADRSKASPYPALLAVTARVGIGEYPEGAYCGNIPAEFLKKAGVNVVLLPPDLDELSRKRIIGELEKAGIDFAEIFKQGYEGFVAVHRNKKIGSNYGYRAWVKNVSTQDDLSKAIKETKAQAVTKTMVWNVPIQELRAISQQIYPKSSSGGRSLEQINRMIDIATNHMLNTLDISNLTPKKVLAIKNVIKKQADALKDLAPDDILAQKKSLERVEDIMKTMNLPFELTEFMADDSEINGILAKVSQEKIGGILIDDEAPDISNEQRKTLLSLYGKASPIRKALEEKLKVKIILYSQYIPKEDSIHNMITISNRKLKGALRGMLKINVVMDDHIDSFMPIGPNLVLAQQLLLYNLDRSNNVIRNQISKIYRAIARQPMGDLVIAAFLRTGIFTLKLPPAVPVDRNYYADLERISAYTLVAA